MKTEIILDALCGDSVTVLETKVFENDGEEYRMAPHAKAYENSAAGREVLKTELAEPYLSAVLAVWGDTPTVSAADELI